LDLPLAASVPKGFVYIPPGPFLFGSSQERSIRKDFLYTVPLHEVTTDAYLVAEHETTFGDWLQYLSALSPAEAFRRSAEVSGPRKGQLTLRPVAQDWELALRWNSREYVMRLGDAFHVPERSIRQKQNWLLLPMMGLSIAEIEEYLAWLRNSNKVVRPRLCNEFEWERAARGADSREYPHGDLLSPSDANYGETYGKSNMATAGPDEIGAHPQSRSPYGINDMSGNIAEFTRSSLQGEEYVLRGGAYSDDRNEIRSANRQPVSGAFRSLLTGLRLCADPARASP
jgi:formylglycine-generating enzyme required for sulfatase activity